MQTCSLINILTSWDILTIKASRMYRMPEKQSWSRMVLNCTRSCFFQYANHLPCHSFSIKLKYPDFFYHFSICFVSFYIILCKLSSFMRIYAFKRKKRRGNVVFTTTAICIYFASLTLICKLLFIRRISLETKMSILNSQMLAFLGTLFILAIKILKAKLQTFHSNVLMRES